MESNKKYLKSVILGIVFVFVLILGISLTLRWWPDVVILFKGSIGIILALVGMFGLFILRK